MKPKPLQNNLMKIYAQLWKAYDIEPFHFEDMIFLKKATGQLNRAMSDIDKCGWLVRTHDKKDGRKTIYHLRHPCEVIDEIASNQ